MRSSRHNRFLSSTSFPKLSNQLTRTLLHADVRSNHFACSPTAPSLFPQDAFTRARGTVLFLKLFYTTCFTLLHYTWINLFLLGILRGPPHATSSTIPLLAAARSHRREDLRRAKGIIQDKEILVCTQPTQKTPMEFAFYQLRSSGN